MASRDTQPQTVCKVPQQQLPGHSAADRVQGCSVDRLTDLHGLAGSQLWGLSFGGEGSCRAVQTPNP
ncbi:unnamed protein product, partial [Staurois parvus]